MRDRFHRNPPKPSAKALGFTLIELMVTVVIVGVLAAIALPSYQRYMMASRREDARTSLSTMVQAQERWRTNNAAYSQDVPALMGRAATDASTLSFKGHYNMSVNAAADGTFVSGYDLHAQPVSTSPQAGDSQCQDIFIRVAGGNLSYRDSTMSTTATTSPCWPQ